MRVFVTGGAGFVGRRLARRLAADGHDVVAPGSREVDVRSAPALDAAVAKARPDAVVHLAAKSSVAASWQETAECFRVNFLGTRNLLRAVETHAAGARLVLVGSGSVYGGALDAPPHREDEPLRPASPYARTKAAAELLGAGAAERGLDVVLARAFTHTGAGQSDDFVASSFARQIAEIAEGRREARMRVGNLASERDFLDVEDVVDAYVRLLEPRIPADVYNVASGRGVAVGWLLETLLSLAGLAGRVEIQRDPARFRPTERELGDASRLRERTGWEPRTPLRETLRGLLEEWRERVREGELTRAP